MRTIFTSAGIRLEFRRTLSHGAAVKAWNAHFDGKHVALDEPSSLKTPVYSSYSKKLDAIEFFTFDARQKSLALALGMTVKP